jgi:glycosyltransferase involved in cell wall biosynthesis
MPRLLLVIPAHNEASRIREGLRKLAHAVGGMDIRVLVADNGSMDAGEKAVESVAPELPFKVEFARVSSRANKGIAIHRAWRAYGGGCEVLAYCDADMAADPEALRRGVDLIASGQADAVAGCRWHPQSKVTGRSAARGLVSRLLSLAWRLLPGPRVTDPGCGLKLVRAASFRSLELPPESGGFAFGALVLVLLGRAGGKVVEIPVVWGDDDARRLRLGRAARDYARAWFRLLLPF